MKANSSNHFKHLLNKILILLFSSTFTISQEAISVEQGLLLNYKYGNGPYFRYIWNTYLLEQTLQRNLKQGTTHFLEKNLDDLNLPQTDIEEIRGIPCHLLLCHMIFFMGQNLSNPIKSELKTIVSELQNNILFLLEATSPKKSHLYQKLVGTYRIIQVYSNAHRETARQMLDMEHPELFIGRRDYELREQEYEHLIDCYDYLKGLATRLTPRQKTKILHKATRVAIVEPSYCDIRTTLCNIPAHEKVTKSSSIYDRFRRISSSYQLLLKALQLTTPGYESEAQTEDIKREMSSIEGIMGSIAEGKHPVFSLRLSLSENETFAAWLKAHDLEVALR